MFESKDWILKYLLCIINFNILLHAENGDWRNGKRQNESRFNGKMTIVLRFINQAFGWNRFSLKSLDGNSK